MHVPTADAFALVDLPAAAALRWGRPRLTPAKAIDAERKLLGLRDNPHPPGRRRRSRRRLNRPAQACPAQPSPRRTPVTSTAPPARVVFVDVETTGLVVGVHEPWEIALIERRADGSEHEHLFYVRPKLSNADPAALRICRFHERTVNFLDLHDQPLDVKPQVVWASPLTVAAKVARITAGAHLVGNVVSFDAGMLDRFLRAHGQAPAWHYHLVDTEALAVGYLEGRRSMSKADTPPLQLPWRSADLSVAVGVEPPPAAHAHTALADARWTRDMYDAITGGAR